MAHFFVVVGGSKIHERMAHFFIDIYMEEATVREEKFHIYLNDDEYSRVIQSLIRLKNSLIAQGRYTDGVDDVLCKVLSAKKRKVKIKYF